VEDQGTQHLDEDQGGEWLPLAEAAAQLGVSVKTARRRLKAGEFTFRQVATQHGQAYEIWVARNGDTTTQTSTVNGAGTQRVDDVTTVELVRLVDRLQRENRDLAGLVGALQERVGTLQLALAAPKEPTSQERPFLEPSANAVVESTQKAVRTPQWPAMVALVVIAPPRPRPSPPKPRPAPPRPQPPRPKP
jgi:hypothetical protein